MYDWHLQVISGRVECCGFVNLPEMPKDQRLNVDMARRVDDPEKNVFTCLTYLTCLRV